MPHTPWYIYVVIVAITAGIFKETKGRPSRKFFLLLAAGSVAMWWLGKHGY